VNLTWATDPVWLIINALVAYRLTRLWVSDELPPLPSLRRKLDAWANQRWLTKTHPKLATTQEWDEIEELKRAYHDDAPVKRLWDCYWCAGFWISTGTILAASLIPFAVWQFIALPFALSAIVGLLGTRD
jgi:hypothetical protein